jgi:hypothetical protein
VRVVGSEIRTLRAGSAGAAAFAAASLTAAARGALPEGLSSLANAVLVTAWRSVGQVNGCVAGVLYALLIRFRPWSAKRLMSPPEYAMPAPTSPLEAKEAPEAPDETVPKAAGRERREAERLIADWEDETRRLSHVLALLTLKTSEMTTEKWANRFIVALRPAIEDCTFLFYGATFAALLELPEKATPSVPMVEQLPARYVPVFTRGCINATLWGTPVRLHGSADRDDGRQELYRAAFIRLSLDTYRQRHFALGAFNCRVI